MTGHGPESVVTRPDSGSRRLVGDDLVGRVRADTDDVTVSVVGRSSRGCRTQPSFLCFGETSRPQGVSHPILERVHGRIGHRPDPSLSDFLKRVTGELRPVVRTPPGHPGTVDGCHTFDGESNEVVDGF